MKFEVRIKVVEKENRKAESHYYATITVEGDIKAVFNVIDLLSTQFDINCMA